MISLLLLTTSHLCTYVCTRFSRQWVQKHRGSFLGHRAVTSSSHRGEKSDKLMVRAAKAQLEQGYRLCMCVCMCLTSVTGQPLLNVWGLKWVQQRHTHTHKVLVYKTHTQPLVLTVELQIPYYAMLDKQGCFLQSHLLSPSHVHSSIWIFKGQFGFMTTWVLFS